MSTEKKRKVTFAMTGDSLVVTRLHHDTPELLEIREILQECDVRFTNLETSIHNYERDIYPSQYSGGDWCAARPEVLDDVKWLGFNMLGLPNNHSMDWGWNGILKTIEHVEKADIVHAGLGENLSEASRPKYMETPQGRVALIAFNTTFETWHKAGEQRRDFNGRPGVNGLTHRAIHRVTEEQMKVLKELDEQLLLAYVKRPIKMSEDQFRFGANLVFEVGEPGTYSLADEEDLERIRRSISEAKRQADIVVVSCHSHERKWKDASENADFQTEVAHFCVDHGADVFVAHGPHVMRGIEYYKGCPILHGLGDFFYQCELIDRAPEDYYIKFGHMGSEACTADGFDYRIEKGGILGELNPKCYYTVIATFAWEDGKVSRIKLIPVHLNFTAHRALKGWPEIARGEEAQKILDEIIGLSEAYGTKIVKNGDLAEVKFE